MSLFLPKRFGFLKFGLKRGMRKQYLIVLFLLAGLSQVFAQAPTLTSISPENGPVGTVFTVTGSNLDNVTALTVGGTSAIVVRNSASEIVGLVMPGTITGVVSVTTAGGTGNSAGNFSITTNAGAYQTLGKIVATGSITPAPIYQGYSVAISSDGKTAAIGGYGDNGFNGAVWIFRYNGTSWVQETKILPPSGELIPGGTNFGFALSLSADGATLAVGGRSFAGNGERTWVYAYIGTSWVLQSSLVDGGRSVSLSASGNLLVVGDSPNNRSLVYRRVGTTWSAPVLLQDVSPAAASASQGFSVDASASGDIIVIGGPAFGSNIGAVWVYRWSGSSWDSGTILSGSDYSGAPRQGTSVSISDDGNTIAFGANYDNNAATENGAVWVFQWNGSSWAQQGSKLFADEGTSLYQGFCVALSGDGNTLVVSSELSSSLKGGYYFYKRVSGVWSPYPIRDLLSDPAASIDSRQGTRLSISSDGRWGMAGGWWDSGFVGAAFPFRFFDTPTITSFTPSSAGRDTTVELKGKFFTGATQVSFGGVNAQSFVVVNDTTINAVVNTGATGVIQVCNAGSCGTSSSNFTFIPAPTITGLSRLQVGIDSVLIIQGTNLDLLANRADKILIGGVAPALIQAVTPTSIAVKIGSGASGVVSVVTRGGTAVSASAIEFIPAPTLNNISTMPVGPKQNITITGTNLLTANCTAPNCPDPISADNVRARVRIGGVNAFQVSSVTPSQIIAQADSGAFGNSISVRTIGGVANFPGFTLILKPTISGFSPSSAGARVLPQNNVTITGTNLSTLTQVQFGGVTGTIVNIIDDNTVIARPAAGSASGTVRVFTQGGNTERAGFVFIPVPTIASVLPGAVNPRTIITITGTSFGSAALQYFQNLTIGGQPAIAVWYDGPTQIRAMLGTYSVGSKTVVVNTQGGTVAYNSINYNYLTPTVSGFTPLRRGVGKPVTISGTRFYNVGSVELLNNAVAGFSVPDSVTAIANMPNLGTGYLTGTVKVTNPGGTATATGTIEYVPMPTINNISRTSGRREENMVILGTNLNEKGKGMVVRIGGEKVDSILASTSTSITIRIGVVQSGSVTVQTEGGVSNPSSQTFTFIAPPSITRIYTSNNVPDLAVPTLDVISVEGQNLFGITLMKLGDVTILPSDLTFLSSDGTLLEFIAPATVNGLVRFAITTFGGGPVFSTNIQVQGVTIEEDQNLRNILRVYPVPCIDTLLITGTFRDIPNPSGGGTISVRTDLIPTSYPVNISLTSVSGQLVLKRFLPQGRDALNERFYLADLPKGVYILSIYYGRQVGYWTIIKN